MFMLNQRARNAETNCTEEIELQTIEFWRLGRRVVEGRFDGGGMNLDGGVMLLSAIDRKLGLLNAAHAALLTRATPG